MKEKQMILDKTSGGFKVFEHYLGKKRCNKKLFRNPYREDDNPSCHIYCKDSLLGSSKFIFNDFGDSNWHGDCFWFVAKIFGKNLRSDFNDVLRIIDRDLNLDIFKDFERFPGSSPILKSYERSEDTGSAASSSKVVSYKPVFRSFTDGELKWWNRYGITLDVLRQYNVRSIERCDFTREDGSTFTIYGNYKYPLFGYSFDKGMKLYRPGSKNRFLFAGTLPKPYIFGFRQLPANGRYIFITGGEKDAMTLSAHGYSAISLNSETARIPTSLCDTLVKRFSNLFVLYDSDKTGLRESALRVKELSPQYPVFRLVLPLAGTKSEKDVSDYFLSGHTIQDFDKLISDCLKSANSKNKNQN